MDYIKGYNNFYQNLNNAKNPRDLNRLFLKEDKTCIDDRERKELRSLYEYKKAELLNRESLANRVVKEFQRREGSEANT